MVQQKLIQLLNEQESRYSKVIELIDKLSAAPSLEDATHRKDVIALQRHLSEIRSMGSRLSAARAEWEQAGRQKTPELSELSERQQHVLAGFLSRMDQLRKVLGDDRDRIRSRLDRSSGHRSMHAAYEKSLKMR